MRFQSHARRNPNKTTRKYCFLHLILRNISLVTQIQVDYVKTHTQALATTTSATSIRIIGKEREAAAKKCMIQEELDIVFFLFARAHFSCIL